jgi:putative transposase
VYGVSERRACGLLLLGRSTKRYEPVRRDDVALRMRLKELALSRPRFGCRRLTILLRREGWKVNHKRVYRLYRLEGLIVRIRRRKKLASLARTAPAIPTRENERWVMDFVSDALSDGRKFRVLTVVDVSRGSAWPSRRRTACPPRGSRRPSTGRSRGAGSPG